MNIAGLTCLKLYINVRQRFILIYKEFKKCFNTLDVGLNVLEQIVIIISLDMDISLSRGDIIIGLKQVNR